MSKPLRKTVELELFDELVAVDVDWHVIEVLERTFNTSADALIGHFVQMDRVQRRYVADVIADLMARRTNYPHRRGAIREHVMTAPPEVFYRWVASLNSALLYSLKHMSDDEFERIKGELAKARAEAADVGTADDDGGDGKKKPASTDSPSEPSTSP